MYGLRGSQDLDKASSMDELENCFGMNLCLPEKERESKFRKRKWGLVEGFTVDFGGSGSYYQSCKPGWFHWHIFTVMEKTRRCIY
ncbi:unnamed protein product [Prunus armeniaca]